MKITLPQNQYFDIAGNPLVAGRLRVYLHDSADPAPLFTLSGDIYTEAPNPVILDNSGEITDTVWFDAAIVDVKVDAPNGDGTYREIAEFETGFSMPEARDDKVVDGIAGLRVANPELGTVTVEGYDVNCHAPARHFVYDPECTDNEDGGCIFESSVAGATGRWILVHADEKIPCSFYGVVPGHEANLAAMMNIPDTVGQWSIQLPKIPRMLPGEYTSNTTYSTSKVLYFDKGARFPDASFVCRSIICPQNDSWLAYGISCGGHVRSSWFRTVENFWHCGATGFTVDTLNYFADTQLRTVANLGGKRVEGQGTMVSAYLNGSLFQVNSASDIPDGFFGRDDYVVVQSDAGDAMFADFTQWDPGLVGAGHHQYFAVEPSLGRFRNADRWVAVMLERRARMTPQQWSRYTLDLQGRTVSGINLPAGSFTAVMNGTVDGSISIGGASCLLRNIDAGIIVLAGAGAGVVGYGSTLRFVDSAGLSGVQLHGCATTVQGAAGWDPSSVTIAVDGGSFDGIVRMTDAHAEAMALHGSVTFSGARIAAHNWRLNRIDMRGCECAAKIDLMPASGADTYYYWTATLVGNRFTDNARVWFGACFASGDGHSGIDGRVRLNQVRIVDNDFGGTDPYGLKMMKYNPVTYNVLVSSDTGLWEYRGNTGKCPLVSVGTVPCGDSWSTVTSGSNVWKVHSGTWNIFCPYNNYGDGSYHLAQDGTGTGISNVQVPYAMWTDLIGGSPELYAYAFGGIGINTASVDDEDANDLFLVKLAVGAGVAAVPPPALDSGNVYFPAPGVV